jgi:hypothetical protein
VDGVKLEAELEGSITPKNAINEIWLAEVVAALKKVQAESEKTAGKQSRGFLGGRVEDWRGDP